MKFKILFLMLSGIFIASTFSETADDFTATDTKGGTHHLYEYLDSGQYVLLDWFFTT